MGLCCLSSVLLIFQPSVPSIAASWLAHLGTNFWQKCEHYMAIVSIVYFYEEKLNYDVNPSRTQVKCIYYLCLVLSRINNHSQINLLTGILSHTHDATRMWRSTSTFTLSPYLGKLRKRISWSIRSKAFFMFVNLKLATNQQSGWATCSHIFTQSCLTTV